MLHEQQMPRYVNRLLRQDLSITPPMSSSSGKFQTIPKVNNFANRPLYLCHISVSDSSLVKIYQRIDRPPSLLLDVSSLLYLFILYIVVTFLYIPFVPVYKGFIWIIQLYRSVSPSDFSQSLDECITQSIRLIIIYSLLNGIF